MKKRKEWKLYEKVHNNSEKIREKANKLYAKSHEKLGQRMIKKHHKGKRVEKVFNISTNIFRNRVHIGELCLALVLSCGMFIFGDGESLPNNQYLVYPLQKVSTLECRTLTWSEMPAACKIDLPLIQNANYQKYQSEKIYTDIYTVLWSAPYSDSWNQSVGAHSAVDIATAKGTPLYAIANGKVYYAGRKEAMGNVVMIQFTYKGETLFAVYEHMDSIDVEAGQTVNVGQKIGTVGNSGNTFGALGGYHVHFEIDKNNVGRPMYAYNGCADTSKGHYTIIQEGLCRTQLQANTKDPIALLESAKQKTDPVVPKDDDKEHNAPDVPSTGGNTTGGTEKPVTGGNTPTPVIPDPEPQPQPQPTEKGIALDFSKVDANGKNFLAKNTLVIEANFTDEIKVGESKTLTISVTDKNGKNYHGIIPQPVTIISSSTNLTISTVSVALIENGKATVTITPKSAGTSYVAINLGMKKIAGLNIKSS